MILFVLYIYGSGGSIEVAADFDSERCWRKAKEIQAVGVVADCRLETFASDLAPLHSPFPMNKPEVKI